MKLVVINADDLGFSKGTNKGVFEAYKKGVLTSTSIMPTGPVFKEAVKMAKRYPKLGIGVHLSLTLGKSILPKSKIPDLVNDESYFYSNSVVLLFKTYLLPRVLPQIKAELKAQINTVLKGGLDIDHLNGQYHVHFMPRIFPIVTNLAKAYQVPFVRVPLEPFFLPKFSIGFLKWFLMWVFGMILRIQNKLPSSFPLFYGILHTRSMDSVTFAKTLAKCGEGVSEILLHPGYFDISRTNFDYSRQGIVEFLSSPGRVMEIRTLTNPKVLPLIEKYRMTLVNFNQAAKILKSNSKSHQ